MSSLSVTGLAEGNRIIQILSAINCRFWARILVGHMRRRFMILLVAFNTVAILLAIAGYNLLHHSNNPVEMRDLQQPLSARVTSTSTPTDSRGTGQRWLSFVSLGGCGSL